MYLAKENYLKYGCILKFFIPPQVALFSDVIVMTLLHMGYYMILKIDALQVLPYNSIEFISSCYTNSCM